MRRTGFLFTLLLLTAATTTPAAAPAGAQAEAAEAERLLRQDCEVVWASAAPYRIDQCTRRAMAALADENRLRDNELKRMLITSERELEECNAELSKALGDEADEDDAVVLAKKRRPKQ